MDTTLSQIISELTATRAERDGLHERLGACEQEYRALMERFNRLVAVYNDLLTAHTKLNEEHAALKGAPVAVATEAGEPSTGHAARALRVVEAVAGEPAEE